MAFETIHRLFNSTRLRRLLAWIRYPLGAACLYALSFYVRREWFWGGAAVALAGEAIQLWCFATLDKRKALAASGPYQLVRNPMYLGRYLIMAGLLLLPGTPGVLLLLACTPLYYFYMVNRVRREETILAQVFGPAYTAYCRQVPRFLPRRWPSLKTLTAWRWRSFHTNHGSQNLLGLLAAFAFLYYAQAIHALLPALW